MFWLLLLCHFIADYPLQTDGMVIAKKQFSGLLMHVFIHFVTLLSLLCLVMKLEITSGVILALSLSVLHFGIDHWKNILSRLRPAWVRFSYIQDQLLHLLSIFMVSFIYMQYNVKDTFHLEHIMVFYSIGFVLATHFWFITERVFSCEKAENFQWINSSMWSRMMSRGLLYGAIFTLNSVSTLALFFGSIIVGWNDLKPERRATVLAFDLGGVILLMGVFRLTSEYLL